MHSVTGLWLSLGAWLLGGAFLPLYGDSFPAFLVEEEGCGLRDEAGNGVVDFALCKTISIFSILKFPPRKNHTEEYAASSVCEYQTLQMPSTLFLTRL
jgi:hypothetical protein